MPSITGYGAAGDDVDLQISDLLLVLSGDAQLSGGDQTPSHSLSASPASAKGPLIRCTVAGSTPNFAAVLRTLRPPLRAARIRFSISGAIRGRPSCLPQPWPVFADSVKLRNFHRVRPWGDHCSLRINVSL